MGSVSTDGRNVLFGLIALRAEVVSPRELAEAMDAWLQDPEIGVADRLIRQGLLREDIRAWIESMVDVELESPEQLVAMVPQPGSTETIADSSTEASVTALTVADDSDPTLPVVPTTEANRDSTAPTVAFKADEAPMAASQSDPHSKPSVIISPSRFRILRSHARGGLGEVFLARDEELGRDVALKEIQERLSNDSRSRSRFLLEAEVTGGLEHPGIVPVYSLGRYPDGRPYYAMRFIKGQSLGEAIEEFHHAASLDPSKRMFLLRNLLRRFFNVCHAIHYAHSRGVLHRDLKPANIMLGKYGETLVVDWGLAKAVGIKEPAGDSQEEGPIEPISGSGTAETMPGSAIGTPQFMSPEQAAGDLDKIGPASDVYSLGATLYCLLTCHAAFEDPDVRVVLHKVQRGTFPPPRSHESSIPHRLQAICLKAMALRPEDRYPSAHALAGDLEKWLADEPVEAYRENLFGRLARWGRRHLIWVQAAAAALAAVAIVATFAAVQVSRARGQEIRERIRVQRMTDQLILNRANQHFEHGRPGHGLLRLATGLVRMEKAADRDGADPTDPMIYGSHAYRANLAAWPMRMHPLRKIFDAPDMILAVATDVDSDLAAIGGIFPRKGPDGGFVRFINPKTGSTIGKDILTKSEVTAITILPGDSSLFFAAQADGDVEVRQRGAAKPSKVLHHPAPVRALLIVDDGAALMTACDDGIVRTWNLATGREDRPGLKHPRPVKCLSVHPGSANLVLTGCDDGEIRIWDRVKGTVQPPRIQMRTEIIGLGVGREEETVTAGAREGTIQTFSLDDGTPRAKAITVDSQILSLTLSRDGTTLAVGCEANLARLYLRKTGAPVGLPLEHHGTVRSLAFVRQAQLLLTGCQDGTARVWEIHPNHQILRPRSIGPADTNDGSSPIHGPIRSLRFGPDSKSLLFAVSRGTGLIQTRSGETAMQPSAGPEPVLQAAFSPDHRRIATVGGSVLRLRPVDPNDKRSKPLTIDLEGARGRSVAFDPTGRFLAVGTVERGARVFDLPSGKPRTDWLEHDGVALAVNFSHDGNWLLVAGGQIVRVWDAETGTPVGKTIDQPGPVYDAVFTPDDRLILTGGENNTARFWNVRDGSAVGIPMLCDGSVMSVDISADGRTVLTGSEDQTVRLWDSVTYQGIGPPYRLPSKVTRVAFSPEDRFIAAAGERGEIRVWNLMPPHDEPSGRLLLWVQSLTGLTLDVTDDGIGIIRGLSEAEYKSVNQEYERGGAPIREFDND